MTETPVPQWIADAARLPIAFAQVREDSLLDLSVLERIGGRDLRVMMIASGGCTAAAFVASGRLSHFHLVDVNPAQLALCRLKLHLLQTAAPHERAQLLGHAELPIGQRAAELAERLRAIDLPLDALGPLPLLAEVGPDHAGRYEVLFAHLRAEMPAGPDGWSDVLTEPEPAERARRIAASTSFGRAMDEAFDCVMALPNLIQLFGVDATRNSIESFSRHFARRTRHAVATLPTSDNPYLWQLLLGRFPEEVSYPWFSAAPPSRMPEIIETVGTIDAALAARHDAFDFVHLSNVLDWLSVEQTRRTLHLARQALRPGGYVFIRQLNSTLDLPALGPELEWLTDEVDALHARDRSFFYRKLHLGRK